MDNQKIYETWKPLRNYLSKMGIRDSLEAIWWYSWYLPFDATNNSPQPLPSMSYDMRIIRSAKYPLLIWELERLAEEMILNGKNFVLSPDEPLKSGRKFCRAVQRLKDINQAASKITLPNISNPLDLLFPITHQQFKYQGHSHDNIAMIRYYRIWSDDTVAKIVQERLGLSIKEILTTSLLMLSHYTNDPAIKDIGASLYGFGVSSEKVQRIIGMIARPLSDIKEEIVHTHILDETYEYQYNPLIAYPVVDFGHDGDSCLVCPIPIDLQLRLLNGLYYDLCNDSRFDDKYDFGNALGDSFQQYVGDILSATLGPSNVYPEEEEPEKKMRLDRRSSYEFFIGGV